MENNFDTIKVDLPSMGECYPEDKRKTSVILNSMTVSDEDIIYNSELRPSFYLDKLINKKAVNLYPLKAEELNICDRYIILLSLMKISYNDIIGIKFGGDEQLSIDDIKPRKNALKGDKNGCFNIKLKYDVLKIQLLPYWKEYYLMENILKNQGKFSELTSLLLTYLNEVIVSINDNNDKKSIEKFVSLLSLDEINEILVMIDNIQPKLLYKGKELTHDEWFKLEFMFENIKN